MTKPWLVILTLALAACGVDGAPIPPRDVEEEEERVQTGISITGSVGAGISGTL